MTCPICGLDTGPDPDTGYDGSDPCPSCTTEGWIQLSDGTYENERQTQYETAQTDPRRI